MCYNVCSTTARDQVVEMLTYIVVFLYYQIVANVGANMCYNVCSTTARDQVVEVLKHFNIEVKQQDIFSRCQVSSHYQI